MYGRDNRWRHLSGKPTSKRVLPEEPWKTTTPIGRVCKRSNALSLPVLIARSALSFSWTMSVNKREIVRSLGTPDLTTSRPTTSRSQIPVCFAGPRRPVPCCSSPAWWPLRGDQTRSHPELGRQTPQRRWYYVSRPGRVGRRQACQEQHPSSQCLTTQGPTKAHTGTTPTHPSA